jgi:hypothetical protein
MHACTQCKLPIIWYAQGRGFAGDMNLMVALEKHTNPIKCQNNIFSL